MPSFLMCLPYWQYSVFIFIISLLFAILNKIQNKKALFTASLKERNLNQTKKLLRTFIRKTNTARNEKIKGNAL